MSEYCSSGCERPEEIPYPLLARMFWSAWFWLRWPYDAHLLKKAGFMRKGWKHWEAS
jgi:hypothetical protein